MSLFVVGDSHSCLFSCVDRIDVVYNYSESPLLLDSEKIYWKRLGPHTAYNINNKLNFSDLFENDSIMVSCGEIDCRVFLPRKKNIQECVDRYVNYLKTLNMYKNIWCLCPPASCILEYTDNALPVHGTNQERNRITLEFNNYLVEKCIDNGFKYINLFPNLVDDDMKTKQEFYWDYNHLSYSRVKCFLVDEFNRYGLKLYEN